MDPNLLGDFRSTNLDVLKRDDLGVHYNFQAVHPALVDFFEYLKFIVDFQSPQITQEETERIESHIKRFLVLRDRIISFNPKTKDNAATYQQLNGEIEQHRTSAVVALRPLYAFLKVANLDLKKAAANTQSVLDEAEKARLYIESRRSEINNLADSLKNKVNEAINALGGRITNAESNFSARFIALEKESREVFNKNRSGLDEYIVSSRNKIDEQMVEVEKKVGEVLESAKKFSAKNIVAEYAMIFKDEAEKVNGPASRNWAWGLVGLIILEISAAFFLFYFFNPVLLEVHRLPNNGNPNYGFILGVLVVKVFVLSTIAVGISQAVKNINAQNHLYAVNKFKANALASFKAFIDATTDPKLIDQIILYVAKAIYSSNVSGYLSKNDSAVIDYDFIKKFVSKQN